MFVVIGILALYYKFGKDSVDMSLKRETLRVRVKQFEYFFNLISQ